MFLPPPWQEAGSCQVKVAGRNPRDRAWAMGWTEEQLPCHYFIVVCLLETQADMQNQSKNYYCQENDTNDSDSIQSFSVFQGQSPQFSRPSSTCINPLGRWLGYASWTGGAGWFVLIMAWGPDELVTVTQGKRRKAYTILCQGRENKNKA